MLIGTTYIYPLLPEQIASHWNSVGQIDGHLSKFWGAFLVPIITIILLPLLYFLPQIDRKKQNIKQFASAYNWLIFTIILYLTYIQTLILLTNLNIQINIASAIYGGIGILLFTIGFFLKKMKQNWLIGIRTPWTLRSEVVWNKTHQKGATVFKIIGIITIISSFAQSYAIGLILTTILIGIIYLFVYSYRQYKKEKKQQLKNN